MAKMFYKLEEAAQKLEITQDQVKELAAAGKLQQFRDRDQLMYKREQVDTYAANAKAEAESDQVNLGEDSGSPIPLAAGSASGDTNIDNVQLGDEEKPGSRNKNQEDSRAATGISVFDADEGEQADPMAQTQVTQPPAADEDLHLESVGSGSGLLDLTRESDDTSLGAELLDEIYPGSGDSATGSKTGTSAGGVTSSSSGVFDGAAIAADGSGPSGLENLPGVETGPAIMPMTTTEVEPYDPVGSGWTAGAMLGALIALIVGIIVGANAVMAAPNPMLSWVLQGMGVLVFLAVLLGVTLVLGVVGGIIGKVMAH